MKWVAWAAWWMAGTAVVLWLGPMMAGLYLIVSGAAGAAFARR